MVRCLVVDHGYWEATNTDMGTMRKACVLYESELYLRHVIGVFTLAGRSRKSTSILIVPYHLELSISCSLDCGVEFVYQFHDVESP